MKIRDGEDVKKIEAGLTIIDAWCPTSVMKEKMFSDTGYFKPYKMKYYDIPLICIQSQEGFQFMEALHETPNDEFFGLESVQSIILVHWDFWDKFDILLKLVPFAIQILAFFLWSNFLLPTKAADGGFDFENKILVGILVATGIYFELVELAQLISAPSKYLSFMRLIDLVGAFLIIYNALHSVIYNDFTVTFWRIQACASLFIYLRLLLVLRYFERISQLVRMITTVIIDMVPFLIVLLVAILAFSDAFFSLDQTVIAEKDPAAEAAAEIAP